MLEKYTWIAEKTGVDADDVMDIVLGTITRPTGVVDDVLGWAMEYDLLKSEGTLKNRLDS